LGKFLADNDPSVVAEAVAAISFENVEHPLLALAEFSATPACWKLSELNQARALNANLRLNNKAGAGRLLDVLANKEAPQATRRLAGYLLRGFLKPWQMDPVEGKKLDWDSGKAPLAEDAKELIASRLPAILASADGEALTAALKLGEIGGIKADDATLRVIALNPKAPEAARAEALHALGAKVSLEDLTTLSKDGSSAIRVAAMKTLVGVQPAAALPALLAGRSAQGLDERQTAWQGLGSLSAPEAVAALKEGLAQVDAGKNEQVALDIYLAAKKQAALATEVKSLETKLEAGPAGVWILAAKGGNAERGEKVFFNPPSACECLKCHKVGNKGASDAGPNLKGFLNHLGADVSKADYSLRGTVATTADLAPNFGFVMLTLKDGSNVTGVFLAEDAKGLKLKVGAEDKTFAPADIKARQSISPMPSLKPLLDSGTMKPEDLRDLTQYLIKIGSDKGKQGH
jgi:putative heme-binding domain-containing protein